VVATAVEELGGVDVLINNAGIFAPALFADLTIDQFRAMVDVHYFGTVLMTKAAWPHMAERGYGRIVNTISEGMLGAPQVSSYGGAKGAVFGLTRNLAVEGAPLGIRANCLAPRAGTRMVDTIGSAFGLPAEAVSQMKSAMPADFVAPVAAYLAHESCPLSGETLQVGAGRVSRLVVVETAGITAETLTVEDVFAQAPAFLDAAGAQERGPLMDS
jgi:NAD(P)-dependent dehydrogenase (short-subunit alcohol dehydrogenase family)